MKSVRESESLMQGYASKKCKECMGRGYIEMLEPGEFFTTHYLCLCVQKRVKKELEE